MKKTVLFVTGLIVIGALSYFGGYYAYMSANPETEIIEPISVQRAISLSDTDSAANQLEYYIARIEQEMLMIYKMPEDVLYDSVKLSSLHFQENEYSKLLEGMTFYSLTEVFEFLENSMS